MAGIGLLHGVHRKGADCVDTGLVELCVRHHGPLCGGVFLARCRRWSSVIVSVVLSTGLSEVRWVNVLSAETPEPVAELEWGVEEAVGAADCSIEGEGQD